MADPQDRPVGEPQSGPPAKKAPAKKAATGKAPGKKAPVKKAASAKAPAKAPAKKAPAKKAPAKKVPAKKAEPPAPNLVEQPVEAPADLRQHAETNGQLAAAKDAAAQAKSTVERAQNPLPQEPPESSPLQSPGPWLVAVALSVLAMLLVRQLRRH
ncbi:Rv3852 family protein [Mycobacterium camsae]|uniref:Rv3852 family protein n=1 Tax=Mycobacterium gordonae TaxID=1778 RepID=UPI001980E6DD|nr:nucleoid-structuring protein H-NS [Mycobacterium gordonae]